MKPGDWLVLSVKRKINTSVGSWHKGTDAPSLKRPVVD